MARLVVHMLPCLQDNYAFLIHAEGSLDAVAIDTPDADAIAREAQRLGLRVAEVWNTHWHPDHAGGNLALKAGGARVTGPVGERVDIPGLDRPAREGDRIALGPIDATVIETPGHTLGHIAYHFPHDRVLFIGDTLFALGCGRLFEGTPDQMWASLSKLMALPDDTLVYCAHEYTASNARFALTIEPDNAALSARWAEIQDRRARNLATVPTTIGEEKATNPFLRAALSHVQKAVGMEGASAASVFAEIRRRKDSFRG